MLFRSDTFDEPVVLVGESFGGLLAAYVALRAKEGKISHGSDEVMLALYKINEVVFDARVAYPFMIYNYESRDYEYRKNSFMKFNPSEKNKHYKMLDETGFYRSTIDNISQYFNKWDEMLRQRSMTPLERDVWLFAMYYDFMSYVAQNLRAMYETGKSRKKYDKRSDHGVF